MVKVVSQGSKPAPLLALRLDNLMIGGCQIGCQFPCADRLRRRNGAIPAPYNLHGEVDNLYCNLCARSCAHSVRYCARHAHPCAPCGAPLCFLGDFKRI